MPRGRGLRNLKRLAGNAREALKSFRSKARVRNSLSAGHSPSTYQRYDDKVTRSARKLNKLQSKLRAHGAAVRKARRRSR